MATVALSLKVLTHTTMFSPVAAAAAVAVVADPIKALTDLKELLDAGVIVGTSNDPDVIRLLPPLTLSVEQAEYFGKALAKVLA